ncbi:MAG: type II toxin-antitoxin system YafQ family toxin [Acidobacteriaceae bacterium]|nr:type II toxin-antitoxin system YafQ family toxin [Acidobacteriaceae bacterium]
MRRIDRTNKFKRDYKRESKGPHGEYLAKHFAQLIQALADDKPLGAKHRDHALVGEWKDHRDLHLQPDLILIYSKPDDFTLQLIRLGSHAELSL